MKILSNLIIVILLINGCTFFNKKEDTINKSDTVRNNNRTQYSERLMSIDSVEGFKTILYNSSIEKWGINVPRKGKPEVGISDPNCILILKGNFRDNKRELYRIVCYSSFPPKPIVPIGCIWETKFIKSFIDHPVGVVWKPDDFSILHNSVYHHILECKSEWIDKAVKELEKLPNMENVREISRSNYKNRKRVRIFIRWLDW